MARDPQAIQREIETARDELASTLDELAAKTSPKTLIAKSRVAVTEKAQTPAGIAAISAGAVLVVVLIVQRFRHR